VNLHYDLVVPVFQTAILFIDVIERKSARGWLAIMSV